MTLWVNAILGGIKFYLALLGIVMVPFEAIKIAHTRRINGMKLLINQAFILYMICLFAVCFFPLPSADEIMKLTYRFQYVPFFFVGDIIKNFSIEAVCQVIFNVVLTVPFGAFLRYRTKMSIVKATLCTLLLSVVIEFGQYTGLFFMYHGSYRVCDVDDLIMNTIGGFVGAFVMGILESRIPSEDKYESVITDKEIIHVIG